MAVDEQVLRFDIDAQRFALVTTDDMTLGFTPREHGRIRALTGLAGRDIIEGLRRADGELIAVLAIIAAERAGQRPDVDAVMDGKVRVALVLDQDDEAAEVDEGPTVAGGDDDASTPATPMLPAATGGPC